MGHARWSDDSDLIETGDGFVAYAWLERMAICIESGMTGREAMRVASFDYQRAMMDTIKNPEVTSRRQIYAICPKTRIEAIAAGCGLVAIAA